MASSYTENKTVDEYECRCGSTKITVTSSHYGYKGDSYTYTCRSCGRTGSNIRLIKW